MLTGERLLTPQSIVAALSSGSSSHRMLQISLKHNRHFSLKYSNCKVKHKELLG